jgi:4-amino-4-deoxy-L-arabinose transferase-like glycosyltransferase
MTPQKPSQLTRDGLLVMIAALLVSGSFLLVASARRPMPLPPDYSLHYAPLARSLLSGKGYRIPSGDAALVYPPGYSMILAGLFAIASATGAPEGAVILVFNVLCGAAVALLLLCIGERALGRRPALIGTLIWITYPLAVWPAGMPNTELPFMVLFYLAVLLVLRGILRGPPLQLPSLAAGFLIGLGSLIRPFALLLSLPFLPVLWHCSERRSLTRRLLPCGLLLLGNLVAILPWEAWAYKESGLLVPLGTNGRTAMLDGLMLDVRPDLPGQVLPVPADVRALIQRLGERTEELDSPGAIVRTLARELGTHPTTILKLLMLKAGRALFGTDSQQFERPVALLQLPFCLLALAGAPRAWKSGVHGRYFVGLLAPLVLYFWGMAILGLSIVRYMLPVLGLVALLIGLLLSTLGERFVPQAPR